MANSVSKVVVDVIPFISSMLRSVSFQYVCLSVGSVFQKKEKQAFDFQQLFSSSKINQSTLSEMAVCC